MSDLSPDAGRLRRAHPLAYDLIGRLGEAHGGPVLEIGAGSGRNTRALRAAGLTVDAIEPSEAMPARRDYAAALSTHALLHGTPDDIARMLAEIREHLAPSAPLFATFGSAADARYGVGRRIDANTFAPDEGEERGVAHAFFREHDLRAMLSAGFTIESLEEHGVDDIVGTWAHARPTGSVHWFAKLVRRD